MGNVDRQTVLIQLAEKLCLPLLMDIVMDIHTDEPHKDGGRDGVAMTQKQYTNGQEHDPVSGNTPRAVLLAFSIMSWLMP
jgi:hypothetical protein